VFFFFFLSTQIGAVYLSNSPFKGFKLIAAGSP